MNSRFKLTTFKKIGHKSSLIGEGLQWKYIDVRLALNFNVDNPSLNITSRPVTLVKLNPTNTDLRNCSISNKKEFKVLNYLN